MLRMLFHEPPRQATGTLKESMQAMEQFSAMLHKRIAGGHDQDHRLRKYEIWTYGLLASLDELEQSQYAAAKFADMVTSTSIKEMALDEKLNYYRHVYFDKNAFIRVFSLLDKLGNLLNDILELHTERVKPHFSYFTVLRSLRQHSAHKEFAERLNDLKERYKEPVSRLRKRRNTEIHHMNTEMEDDLRQSHEAYGSQLRLENLTAQMQDLEAGLKFVSETLLVTFTFLGQLSRKRQ